MSPRYRRLPVALLLLLSLTHCIQTGTTPMPTGVRMPTLDRTPHATFTLRPSITPTRTPFQAASNTPTPTPQSSPTPIPTASPTLPPQARIQKIVGYGQTLPLSCESRSAVDWASYFGVQIYEMDLFYQLPRSNDPETGFVGDPYGAWGQIPPGPYGIHAAPVAEQLRAMGAHGATAAKLTLAEAQREIAQGRPVMVWIVGHVEPGRGVPYLVNGFERTVARYEHTVILIGYDANTVTILDGATIYQRSTEVFLTSWGALGNLALVWRE